MILEWKRSTGNAQVTIQGKQKTASLADMGVSVWFSGSYGKGQVLISM